MKKAALLVVVVVVAMLAGCSKEPVTITLAAEDADLTTDGALVLEQDNESGAYNVGWWETITDEVSWDINVEQAGSYTVSVNYSCDPQFPGSTIVVSVGSQSVQGTIRDTGAWSSYVTQELGTINLQAGTRTVSVRASSVANRFVCNLRTVVLSN